VKRQPDSAGIRSRAEDAPARETARAVPVATPEGPGDGKVRLRAYPTDAEIFIDGTFYGRGLVVDSVLRAGERRLRITAPGYEPYDTTFIVRSGETAQLPRVALRAAGAKP
jgi:hypothetical protein